MCLNIPLPRSALGTGGSAVLLLQASGGAELRVDSSPADLSLPLARLDQPQARAEVKELLFGMAALLAQQGACSAHHKSPVLMKPSSLCCCRWCAIYTL